MSDGELRQLFRKHLPQFDWQAIESGSTAGGIPDLNYATKDGFEGWIECKTTDHWRVKVRPMQIGWIEKRLRYNPRVFVAVRRTRDELWFFPGLWVRRVAEMRLDRVSPIPENQYNWTGGPARWDWNQIARWLVIG